MFEYQYVLKKAGLRDSIDLRNHETGIIQGIMAVFEDLADWNVSEDHYYFCLTEEATPRQLRLKGRVIVRLSEGLKLLVKKYNYQNPDGSWRKSGQLFIRVR